jgi:hypothetical protein
MGTSSEAGKSNQSVIPFLKVFRFIPWLFIIAILHYLMSALHPIDTQVGF